MMPHAITIVPPEFAEKQEFEIPLVLSDFNGLLWYVLRPHFEQPTAVLAHGVVIDDRVDGAGPKTFDREMLFRVIKGADRIVVDAASPKQDAYARMADEALHGARIVVVQTIDKRRLVWQELARAKCEPSAILELFTNRTHAIIPTGRH
jgi:hypothetical protein